MERTRGRIKITHRCIIYIYIQNEHSAINEHAVIEVYELIINFFYSPEEFIFRSWYDLRRRPPHEKELGYSYTP